jgi:hypothetical protein
MRRKLFPFAAALSAVLCISLLTLYAGPTDGSRLGAFLWEHSGTRAHLYMWRERRWMVFGKEPVDIVAVVSAIPPARQLDFRRWTFLECEFRRYQLPNGETAASFWIPYQIPMLVSAVLPLTWIGLWARRTVSLRNRRRQGFCSRCGYDLRATPRRCPECGAVPAGKGERR